MSYNDSNHQETNNHEPKAEDSFADAICAVMLIGIGVVTMIYWISNQ